MCHPSSIESLLSFGLPDINKILRRSGYSLQKIDSTFVPGNYMIIPLSWKNSSRVEVCIGKDSGGLYMETRYVISQGDRGGKRMSLRYDLERRESNLKAGTFRYYIRDPYPQEERLCTKLYLLPDTGVFVPRSVLTTYGVLYSQQRKGHTARYYFSPKKIPETKYRKSHYRGRITPFWESYRKLCEERDWKIIAYGVGKGYARGVLSPEWEKAVISDFISHTGRKSVPRDKSL